jgi:hypothetical protein
MHPIAYDIRGHRLEYLHVRAIENAAATPRRRAISRGTSCSFWLSGSSGSRHGRREQPPPALVEQDCATTGIEPRSALRPVSRSQSYPGSLPRRRRYLSISRRSQSRPKSPPIPRSTIAVMATPMPVPSMGQ